MRETYSRRQNSHLQVELDVCTEYNVHTMAK